MYATKIIINLKPDKSVKGILADYAEADGDREKLVGTLRLRAEDLEPLLPNVAAALAQIDELENALDAETKARETAEKEREDAMKLVDQAALDRDGQIEMVRKQCAEKIEDAQEEAAEAVAAASADRDAKVAEAEAARAAAVAAKEAEHLTALSAAQNDVTTARAEATTQEARAVSAEARVAELEARIAELTAPPADPEISDRQLFQQLAIEKEITEEEAEAAVATGTIPEAMMALVQALPAEQQFGARMMLKGATTIKRRHPMTALIGQLYGWDDAELDRFFAAAGVL